MKTHKTFTEYFETAHQNHADGGHLFDPVKMIRYYCFYRADSFLGRDWSEYSGATFYDSEDEETEKAAFLLSIARHLQAFEHDND